MSEVKFGLPFGLSEALDHALREAPTSNLIIYCTNMNACRRIVNETCRHIPCELTTLIKESAAVALQLRAGLEIDRRLPLPNTDTLPDRNVALPPLSPCPTCKKPPEVIVRLTTDGAPYYLIQCLTCPAGTGKMRMTIPEAATLWEHHYGALPSSREGL